MFIRRNGSRFPENFDFFPFAPLAIAETFPYSFVKKETIRLVSLYGRV